MNLHGIEQRSTNSISNGSDLEKNPVQEFVEYDTDIRVQEGRRLNRDLKARHVSMIAIGGSLGTGLLIGTGSALMHGSCGSVFICYSVVGLIVFIVMSSLGEMATYIPLPDGFSGYASRFCDDALGFAVGYAYLIKYLIITPNQLTAAALVILYWVDREKVNPGVWITVFLVVITLINYFGVKFFGEFEFWLSSFKVVTVLGLILLLFILMLGGGPTHDRTGFRYWSDPGAFAEYKNITGPTGRFVAFVSVFVNAVFAYLGTELVGVVVGEARNPRKNIPRAIKLTFFRIAIFYCVSVLLLGCCLAYNDPNLIAASKKSTSASASPFVVAVKNAKIKALPDILNVCILLFVFSACNSDLYIGSRTLYGLSINRKAPLIFSKTNKNGVPYIALAFCVLFCLLAYMNVSSSSTEVFSYFVNVVSIFGLLTWVSILVTHIFFMRALKAQGIDRKRDLVYRSPFQPYSDYISLFLCCLICLVKNFTVFLGHKFDYKNFITGYIGIPVYLICLFGYKFIMRSKTVKPHEADLYSYKDIIDAEEMECNKEEAELKALRGDKKDFRWLYEKSLGYIF